ncbi:LPS assembly lipoprotein LptE [Thermosulfurimonas marina]|uniref:LPS-assembly lipoprotein LptE n=1 Tax=Thermosulfurimonas marina TaxID=2047767 RepID=UPI001B313229|nr:LptE family protein [Thermosulfurimonas marina]
MWWAKALALLLVVSSCGYHLRGRPPGFSSEWKSLYVEIFRNRTSETRAGVLLTEALRERFARSGFLKLASSPKEADLVLSGEVVRLWIGGVSYNRYTETLERRLSVELRAELRAPHGKILWRNTHLTRYETYPVEGTSEVIDPGREIALRKLAEDLADIIYHQITASF